MTEERLHEALAAWNTGDADRVLDPRGRNSPHPH